MEPITNEEKYLAALTGESVILPDPITRKEIFLAAAAGVPVSVPDPITREEIYLSQIKPGDGTGVVLEPLTVTENGEYTPGAGVDGFDKVTVEVDDPVMALCSSLPSFTSTDGYPDPFVINAPRAGATGSLFINCNSVNFKTLEVNMGENPITMGSLVGGGGFKPYGVETIRVRAAGSEIIQFKNVTVNYMANCPTVKTLDFVMDLSLFKNILYKPIGAAMEDMRFLPNTVGISTDWSASSVLTDETLVSLANGLLDNGALTVTLSDASKERCAAILGAVSTVDEGYSFFYMDEAGAVTLTEFITTVKGWTVA